MPCPYPITTSFILIDSWKYFFFIVLAMIMYLKVQGNTEQLKLTQHHIKKGRNEKPNSLFRTWLHKHMWGCIALCLMNHKPPCCEYKENVCLNLTNSATRKHYNLEKWKEKKCTLSVWCYPMKFITHKMANFIPVKGRNRRCMHRRTILAVHSHLFTSKCRTFHKCAGHKKRGYTLHSNKCCTIY